MGYSSKVYKAAADKLFERRLKAEKGVDKRRNEIYARIPRVEEIEKLISTCEIKVAKAVVRGGDVVSEMKTLRDQNLALQNELTELLAQNGYPSDVFAPHYYCQKCRDTGYYDENGKTLVCSCLKNALVTCACAELNRNAPLALSTFETFSLDYYDKKEDEQLGTSPYKQMNKILNYCKSYADNFKKDSESILMKGATGLGKTHLSLAIANEVIKKGFGVIYSSAPSLMNQLEKNFFSRGEKDDSTENMLLECDLLIVDDLGTEFHGQFSISQLYNIFNSRMLSNKPLIINTNLTMRELEKIYNERFVSRINGNAQKLDFLGKDIRIRKK